MAFSLHRRVLTCICRCSNKLFIDNGFPKYSRVHAVSLCPQLCGHLILGFSISCHFYLRFTQRLTCFGIMVVCCNPKTCIPKVLVHFLCNLSCCSSKLYFPSSVCRKLFDGGSWNLLDGGREAELK